jgi:hypothetical protein
MPEGCQRDAREQGSRGAGELAGQRDPRHGLDTRAGDFDIKAFHRAVLEDGALPLDGLEAKIDRWSAARRA